MRSFNYAFSFPLLFLFIALPALALPTGIAEVYSTYRDIKTQEVHGISGFGVVYKLNFAHLDTSEFVVHTASHLSQGGTLDPAPRLAVRLPLKIGKNLIAYPMSHPFSETLRSIVQGDPIEPIIAGSYFANGKDSELFILEASDELKAQLTYFVEIDISRDGVATSHVNPEALTLDPNDKTWRIKKIRESLFTVCPTRFSSCATDDKITSTASSPHRMFDNIGNLGLAQTEYDWLIFTRTNQGMSGLPVLSADSEDLFDKTTLLGSISSSSKVSDETWVNFANPAQDYVNWVNIWAQHGMPELPIWIGEQDILWERENGVLRRRLTGLSHVYIEAENSGPLVSGKGRCDNGGAFRFDNGGAFRFDNGETLCTSPVSSAMTSGFKVRKADGTFAKSNLLIVEHSSFTRIVPSTVAGMTLSQYTKDFELSWRQKGVHVGVSFTEYVEDDRQVKWSFFKELFASFYAEELVTAADRQWLAQFNPHTEALNKTTIFKFKSPLAVAKVARTQDGQKLSEEKGQLTLYSYVDSSESLVGVLLQINIEGRDIQQWVSFSQYPGLSESQFFEPLINIEFDNQPAVLELAGLLTHNPDRQNLPDLYPTGKVLPLNNGPLFNGQPLPYKVNLMKSDGDLSMRTIFTLHATDSTYYLYVP